MKMKAKRRPRLDIAVISRYNTMLRLETCYVGQPVIHILLVLDNPVTFRLNILSVDFAV
jgi:hypothetical protein